MQQFIPVTDELMERTDLPSHWSLVPYQVDHPCFRWSIEAGQQDLPMDPARDRCNRLTARRRAEPVSTGTGR